MTSPLPSQVEEDAATRSATAPGEVHQLPEPEQLTSAGQLLPPSAPESNLSKQEESSQFWENKDRCNFEFIKYQDVEQHLIDQVDPLSTTKLTGELRRPTASTETESATTNKKCTSLKTKTVQQDANQKLLLKQLKPDAARASSSNF